jgi:DNA-binding MurR/RpiR family transcriptional regulator
MVIDGAGMQTGAGRIAAMVRSSLPRLVPSEARVARYVVAQPAVVIRSSIHELSAAVGVSTSSVMRFCQRLGYSGYQDFKIALAQDSSPAVQQLQSDVLVTDSEAEVLKKVVLAAGEAVVGSLNTVDGEAFKRAIDILDEAEQILVIGIGSSIPLVQDIGYRLLTIGLRTQAPIDLHVQHVSASLLGPNDACLAISHTGTTRETTELALTARSAGARVVAVTSFFGTPFIEAADVALVAGSKETSYRQDAMASRLAHLAVLDALYVGLAMRDPARTEKAQLPYHKIMLEHRFR